MYNRFKVVGYAAKKGTGGNPRHTIIEIAAEFNVTTGSLAQIIKADDTAPKPVAFDKGGAVNGSKHPRYDIVEIRKWWKARQIRINKE